MNAASFDYAALNARLAKSKFRMRFRLSEAECAALAGLGKEKLRAQTRKILQTRLAAAHPSHDGSQTPMRGFAVFVAQHATACCCRRCLRKFYGIEEGRTLTFDEIEVLTCVILRWIDAHCGDLERFAHTPDLF